MITIYRNDTELFSTEINSGSSLSRQLMSDDYITLKFSLLEPIKFELGDFCDCDFGRYELITPYNPSYNATTGGYDYELRLDAEYRKWKNKIFQYRPQYGGIEASWSLTNTIDVFMQVFLSNLTAHGYKYRRETEYHVEYSDDVDLTESKVLSFSNTNLIDALSQIAEEWETEWWVDNNVIHFGKCQLGTEDNALDFEDGVNVTAMSSSSSASDYVTRLYVFGATTNVPSRYRKDLIFDAKTVDGTLLYDTARPLSLNMFNGVQRIFAKSITFNASTGKSTAGVDAEFKAAEGITFSDKGVYTMFSNSAEVSIMMNDPHEKIEKNLERAMQTWGFYFTFNVYVTVKAIQGENVIASATNHTVTEEKLFRYDNRSIGSFKLPELKITDSKSENINISVFVRVCIEGSTLLQFASGIEEEGMKTTYDIGASIDNFSIEMALSQTDINIYRQRVTFPIKVLSGTQTGSTDNATFDEGAENMTLTSLALSLGDKYTITDNIILPKVPAYYFTDTYQSEIVKTSVVERHLMLPLSWNNGHNWIDAEENMSEEEIVEGVLVLDDIYPKAKCTIVKVLSYKIEIVDEETNKKTGQYNTYYLVATDDMALKKDYLLSTESNFEISFNTGSLNGMTFEFDLKEKGYVFENVVQEDGTLASQTLDRQYFHIYASEDYGRLLPDPILAPKVGDEFYVLNYDASYFNDMGLTTAAEEELLEKGKEYMEKNKIDPNTYSCPLYWWYAKEKGILPFGQRINLISNAFFKTGKRASRIIGLQCNLDVPYDTPTYTVGEEASYSRLGDIEDKLDEIELNGKTYIGSGGSSSGSSVYLIKREDITPASDTNAYSSKRSDYNYPSKQTADTFNGLMTFVRGIALGSRYSLSELGEAILSKIKIGDYGISDNGNATLRDTILRELTSSDYDAAAQTGYGMKMKSDGKYKLSLTDLEVWGRAIFHELEIRKLSYAGGNFLFSPAGSTIFRVDVVSGGYQCYFLADDGSTATENLWKVGDLALCESFNIEDGAYTDVGNKRYWRKVIAVSTENETITDDDRNELYGGQKFGWVTLSATDCETDSDTPAAGDTIVCLGNASDTSRQNAIIIKTMGDEDVDAPAFIQYAGINTYSLTGKDKTVISPSGNKFTGDFVTTAGENLKSAVSELKNTVKGISTTVSEVKSTVDGHGNQLTALETDVTQIKQTAESISLKVDRQSVKGRNLIPMSYFFHTSNAYDTDTRKFLLESGKKYSFSVNGHIDTALKNGGGVLRVFIYNAAWSWSAHIDIDATTDTTAKLEGDNAVTPPSTGEYYLSAYAFHADIPGYMKAQEGGTFTLNWAQLEEGEVCTPWSLHESDPAIQGNLLPSLGGKEWTRMVNITTEGLEVNGVRLPNMHYSNEATTSKDVLSIGGFALEGNSSYTLSFWVKGSGTMESYVYPDAVMYAEDNAGQTTTAADGCLGRTLSSVWERVRIRFNTKQLNTNALYNAGFDAMGGTQTTWSYLWDFTGKPTRPTRVKVDGYYPAYVQKSATTDAFCDLSQDVGATLTAGWWTLTFKVKSSYAVRLLVSGVTFGAVDGSGNTVCVDGVNKAIPASGDVRYIDFAASSDAFTEHSVTFKVSSAETTARLFFRCYDGDFYLAKPMLTNGAAASGFATREAGQAKNILPCRLLADSEVWIGGVKLEQGGTMTDYSEDTVQELYATGIDILNRSITVTADNFTIENNRKERTFSVDAEGRVTMNHISLGGTINKQAVEVTADNFGALFDFYLDEKVTNRYEGNPKIANLYGIYYFTEAIGKETKSGGITLNMPSAYQDDDGYYCGNVWDDNNKFSSALLRSIRALVGNTVLIYNDSPEDICVYGMSPYFTDVWVTANSAKIAAATTTAETTETAETTAAEATIATTAVEATFSPSTKDTATDATSSLERDTTGSVAPNQRYAGKQRDYMTVTLQGGKHQFVSLTCVCEVGKLGRENIYWLVNYGAAFDTE